MTKISKGEEKIISILKKERISFEREKTFSNLKKHGNHLRIDFYLPSKNVAIEFNGLAHYKKVDFFHKSNKDFKKRQEYDRYKIGYCLANRIKLYIIPFWELDNIKESKDLFQNKFLAQTQWKNDLDWKEYRKNI